MAGQISKRFKNRCLRIVQVISNYPNARPVPSPKQGGTEKIVYELTEELVRRGHDVYLFAARGSRSRAKLITYPRGLKNRKIAKFVIQRMPSKIDIIHDHTFSSVIGRKHLHIPTVCTLHIPVKHRVKNPVYVSKRARKVMGKKRGDYVYNGINPREYEFSKKKHSYLLFMGRILKEKGILKAIAVAEKTGKKLIIAGPIKDPVLFRKLILPHIRKNPKIRYVGAVGGKQKQALLKHAQCLLFPVLWEEPFGLVMIEAMACGTPVLALNKGSVPEILSKFPDLICNSVKDMAKKVKKKRYPSPSKLRKYVKKRFTTAKMTDRYLKIYRRLIKSK